jgi:hypothetical protein
MNKGVVKGCCVGAMMFEYKLGERKRRRIDPKHIYMYVCMYKNAPTTIINSTNLTLGLGLSNLKRKGWKDN